MPGLNFLERFPLPSLRLYVGLSGLLFLLVSYYAYETVTEDPEWHQLYETKLNDMATAGISQKWLDQSTGARLAYFMMTDQLCIWALVNTACCALFLVGKAIQFVVFGKLRFFEHQQLRERFWNFLFYKCIFVFGVLNLQFLDEVVLWSLWFGLVGFFHLLCGMAQDRFKYVASSPPNSSSIHMRVMMLMGISFAFSCGFFVVAAVVSYRVGFNYGAFLAAECMVLFFRSLYCFLRYAAHLYNISHDGPRDRRSSFVYYTELVFELLILLTEFLNHLHMLIWSNTFLTMASLVICMQLRHLYQEIDRRLKKHRNHQRVIQYIDENYPAATSADLSSNDDNCAICWDLLDAAKKLPCGHLFHHNCLRGWLEQDPSCPTCRLALSAMGSNGNQPNNPAEENPNDPTATVRRRHRANHVFNFDGGRYARWLPSFSVQVSHNIGGTGARGFIFSRATTAPVNSSSQIGRMAQQVQEMFPQMPLQTIIDDLHDTNSAEATIENILENRLFTVGEQQNQESTDESSVHTTSDEDNYSDSSTTSLSSTASGDSPASSSSTETPPVEQINIPALMESSQLSSSASRFSKSSDERETILEDRRHHLIDWHRRMYLRSSRAEDLRQRGIGVDTDSHSEPTTSTDGLMRFRSNAYSNR